MQRTTSKSRHLFELELRTKPSIPLQREDQLVMKRKYVALSLQEYVPTRASADKRFRHPT